MPGGRRVSYRNTGGGTITPVASIDLEACKGNVAVPRRNIEWRGDALDINDAMRRKAAYIYSHGVVVQGVPCSRCVNGSGPFKDCVVAFDDKGYIANGVCANCYWLHRTDLCSSRKLLPCEALWRAGFELGGFEEACKAHCGSAHSQILFPLIFPPSPSSLAVLNPVPTCREHKAAGAEHGALETQVQGEN
jgi:Protein of unknown function (DUF3716)